MPAFWNIWNGSRKNHLQGKTSCAVAALTRKLSARPSKLRWKIWKSSMSLWLGTEKNATMCRCWRRTGWSYDPCKPYGSEKEEVGSAPRVADRKRKEQDNPNRRKVKLPKLDPVRSPSPEFEHQKKKEKTGVQKGKKCSHHRREECPFAKRRFMASFATCANTHKRVTLVQTKSCASPVCQRRRVGGEAQVVLVMTLCDSLSQGPSTPAEAEDCAASTSAEPEAEVKLSDSKADSEESD